MSTFFHVVEISAGMWSASIWRASLEGAVVIAIVMVTARWCTFISPRIIHWIWRLACLKVLISFLSIQPIAIALLPPPPIAAATMEIDTPSLPPKAISTEPDSPVISVIGTPQVVAQVAPPQYSLDIRAILMLLWSLGLISCMALTLKQWLSARRLRRAAVVASSDRFRGALQSEASRLGIRRLPQLCLSPHVEGPVLTGIWRPTILLSLGIDASFDESELRLMLAHELAHLKRHDLAWNWLPTIVGWLLFFHPLVWLMKRCWFEAQEAACDELLIQNKAAQPVEYGQLLLKLATYWPREPRTGLATAGVLGAYRNLQRRIIAMSRVKPFSPRRLMAAAALLLLIALAAIIPWRLAAQESGQQMLVLPVRVVDADGEPVAKAKLTPWALRTSQGHWGWGKDDKVAGVGPKDVFTEQDGTAAILYPQYRDVQEQIRTTAVSLFVDHPDFAYIDNLHIEVPRKSKGSYEIKLTAGVSLEIRPLIDDQLADLQNLFALWSDGRSRLPGAHAEKSADGTLRISAMPPGKNSVLLVKLDGDRATHFSKITDFELKPGETERIDVSLHPSLRIRGSLSDDVPRPVHQGRLQTSTLPPADADSHRVRWFSWASIQPDGTFVIDGWPADERVQLIALCEGYKATSGEAPDVVEHPRDTIDDSLNRPQVFDPSRDEPIKVAMTPLAPVSLKRLMKTAPPSPT